MIIYLRRMLVHHLLCSLHRISVLQLRLHSALNLLIRIMLRLLFGMLVQEQISYRAFTSGALVDGKAGRELSVGADGHGIEEVDGEVLAVVGD